MAIVPKVVIRQPRTAFRMTSRREGRFRLISSRGSVVAFELFWMKWMIRSMKQTSSSGRKTCLLIPFTFVSQL
jgi:hypothetical protein